MAATPVATVTAPQVVTRGKNHCFTFPIKVLAFNEGFWGVHDWVLIVSQHVDSVGAALRAWQPAVRQAASLPPVGA